MLTSRQNPRFQAMLKLKMRKHRRRQKRLLAEGPKLVEDGLAAGWKLSQLALCREMLSGRAARLLERELPVLEISPHLMAILAETDSPQGIVGAFEIPSLELSKIAADLVLVVDGLQDPGNMGTLLRTAAAVGATALLCLRGSVDITSPKVVRASMGGVFRLPWLQELAAENVAAWAERTATRLVQLAPRNGIPFHRYCFSPPLALVVGNEAAGVGDVLGMACDDSVTIPMPGGTESLNAAVAAALVMYQFAIRQGLI